MTLVAYSKHPTEILDYELDWSDWLSEGETITSYTVTADTGITKEADSKTGNIVTIWLSGGTAGERYVVTCTIVTNMLVKTDVYKTGVDKITIHVK